MLPERPTLQELQAYVANAVRDRGFDQTDVAKRFMLLLEECGEFARAARKQAGMKFAEDTHMAELSHEAADVLIVLLGICNMLDVDLEQAFRDKEELNKKRTWK
jgi:NTP pyrophosphatase (non-canonical NTP hydrolase)